MIEGVEGLVLEVVVGWEEDTTMKVLTLVGLGRVEGVEHVGDLGKIIWKKSIGLACYQYFIGAILDLEITSALLCLHQLGISLRRISPPL